MNRLATFPESPTGGCELVRVGESGRSVAVARQLVPDACKRVCRALAFPLGTLRRPDVGQRPVNVEGDAAYVEYLLHRRALAQRIVGHVPNRAVNRDPILQVVGIHDGVPHALRSAPRCRSCVDGAHDAQTLTAGCAERPGKRHAHPQGAPLAGRRTAGGGLAKGPEIARRLSRRGKVPAFCRDFVRCEVLAISGIRRCTRGEKSALMPADDVELSVGGLGRDERPGKSNKGQLRGLLLPCAHAVRGDGLGPVRHLPPQPPRRAAAAPAAAVCVPSGPPPPGRVGVSVGQRAARAARGPVVFRACTGR